MKNFFSIQLLLMAGLLLVTQMASAQHFTTVWSGNPYNPMNIVVQNAQLNNLNLQAGDEIAVFDKGDKDTLICVGTIVLAKTPSASSPAVIIAAQDDNTTSTIDGFTDGHTIIFKYWIKKSLMEISNISAAYNPSFNTKYANHGTAVVSSLKACLLPQVNAGKDDTICETQQASLSGSASNYSSVYWKTGGDGSFKDSTKLSTIYTPGKEDIANGSVALTLSARATENCDSVATDTLVLHIVKKPTASAGADDTICENKTYTLQGTAENYSSVVWRTNGDGTFGDSTKLGAVYTPGKADLTADSVVLTLYAYPLLHCDSTASDAMVLHFVKIPTANAGADDTICENKTYTLQGTAENYSSVVWRTNGDGIFSDSTKLNAVYTPGKTDLKADSVVLTLYARPLVHCDSTASDAMVLHLVKIPTVSAGANDTICENKTYTLQGTAEHYSTVVWKTNGDGTFSDSTKLAAVYTPGKTDKSSGSVILILTAHAKATCCSDVSDSMTLHLVGALDKPETPQGKAFIMEGADTVSKYTIKATRHAASYQWFLAPSKAGEISGIGTTGTVKWNSDYTGTEAYVYVAASNGYCSVVYSDSLKISLSPLGISRYNSDNTIVIAPNPTNGKFSIILKKKMNDYRLMIINITGEIILQKRITSLGGQYRFSIDLNNYPSGIYYLQFVSKNNVITKKILINK